MKSFAFAIILSVLLFILVNRSTENIEYVKIAGESIKVVLALTDAERERGLSGQESLKEGEGMLFIFTEPDRHSFWMKGMNFPLDIVWIGEDMKVVYIKKDARPESYPELYRPLQEAKYVLETVTGFSDKYGLQTGDKVEFAK